jgi:hypothetical protein
VRDPCAKHLANSVLAWHGLAVNVLVEGVHDRTCRPETPPIYVRIVEVAGSSPVTSTKGPWSDDIGDQARVWRPHLGALAEASNSLYKWELLGSHLFVQTLRIV